MPRGQPKKRKSRQSWQFDVTLGKSTSLMTRADDPFSPVEIDYFKRAQQLYASTFDTWEDFDPEAR